MDDKIRQLIEWIARNSYAEPLSGFLPGGPLFNINAHSLLDEMCTIFDYTKDEIGEVFNPVREKVEAEILAELGDEN